jgi:enoyl-CoA hydratase/carnithine racemase
MLTANDYTAEFAAQYGWINRAMPAGELAGFVSRIAHRIA